MKNNFLFLGLCVFFFTTIQAQEQSTVSVKKNMFKINVLLPGFVYERGLSTKNTLYSELSYGLGYRNSDFYDESTFVFFPVIKEQFRHYYNLDKRAAKGKRTAFNSGNFVGMQAMYRFKSISTNKKFEEYEPALIIASVWGFQRTYKRKFNLGLNMGFGANFEKNDTDLVFVGNFTLGWIIGK